MKARHIIFTLVTVLLVFCNLTPASLVSQAGQRDPQTETWEEAPPTPPPGGEEESQTETWEEATPTPLPAGARVVYLLGRSVTGLWFSYWGWQGDDTVPVVHGRYVLFHRDIDTPENMVDSVRSVVAAIPDTPNPIIHYKLCFDDYSGGDEAQATLERNKQIVRQVYQIVVEQHHHRLVIGNALPKVSADTDPELVAAHRQYNQWLTEFAAAHPEQVYVLDQYAVLANANGALQPAYASAHDDSHPNRAGYRALDVPYFALLDRIP